MAKRAIYSSHRSDVFRDGYRSQVLANRAISGRVVELFDRLARLGKPSEASQPPPAKRSKPAAATGEGTSASGEAADPIELDNNKEQDGNLERETAAGGAARNRHKNEMDKRMARVAKLVSEHGSEKLISGEALQDGVRGEVITDLFGPRLHNALGTWTFNVEWDRDVGGATLERRDNLHPLLIEAFGDPE